MQGEKEKGEAMTPRQINQLMFFAGGAWAAAMVIMICQIVQAMK